MYSSFQHLLSQLNNHNNQRSEQHKVKFEIQDLALKLLQNIKQNASKQKKLVTTKKICLLKVCLIICSYLLCLIQDLKWILLHRRSLQRTAAPFPCWYISAQHWRDPWNTHTEETAINNPFPFMLQLSCKLRDGSIIPKQSSDAKIQV